MQYLEKHSHDNMTDELSFAFLVGPISLIKSIIFCTLQPRSPVAYRDRGVK